jgi:hypothetical protein
MLKKIALLLVVLIAVLLFARSVNRIESGLEPEQKITAREWEVADSKAYAQDVVLAWADNQYLCLEKLWTKESNWRPEAYNKVKVMGKNAGGIPQILGMSTQTPAPKQIDRGFNYIMHRYGTPCTAWKFHQKNGWY